MGSISYSGIGGSIGKGSGGTDGLGTVAAVSVTSTATSHTISADRTAIAFQNQGTSSVWFGDANVDADNNRGWQMTPLAGFTYENCSPNFVVYFQCKTGESSTIAIVEG